MNVNMQKLEHAGNVREGDVKLMEKLETVSKAAAKRVLGTSETTNDTALRPAFGMYPLEPNRNKKS